MDEWVTLDQFYEYLRKEMEAELTRGKLLSLYEATWNDEEREEMSNRKKIKDKDKTDVRNIISTQTSFAGHYNGYICNTCGLGYLTLDVDAGTTPMFGPCLATEKCNGTARSMGYPEGEPPVTLGEPIIHWVKPTAEEFNKLSYQVQQHVMRGGLIRKETTATPEWVKEIL